jgi:hypothetical protein
VVWNRQRPDAGAARQQAIAAARRRGVTTGAVGLAAAAVFAFVLHRRGLALVVAAIAVATTAIALVSPLFLYPRLTRALELLGHAVGTAVTWALMTLLYVLLFVPFGLAMRWTGKLNLRAFKDPHADSYWTPTEGEERTADSYRKQF